MINKDLRSVGIFGTGVANCKSRKRSIFSQNKDALSFILLGFLFVVPAVASVCVCVCPRQDSSIIFGLHEPPLNIIVFPQSSRSWKVVLFSAHWLAAVY